MGLRCKSSTPEFDRTCNGFNGRSLVFDSDDPRADRFTVVRREIAEYVGKEYTDRGNVRWTLEQERTKMTPPPSIMVEDTTDVDKKISMWMYPSM